MKYYKFSFIQKPWKTPLIGKVQTDNFLKWFMENAPFGVRLVGTAHEIGKDINLTDYSNGFSRLTYNDNINMEEKIEE